MRRLHFKLYFQSLIEFVFHLFCVGLLICYPIYSKTKEIQKQEIWIDTIEPGTELIMVTDEGNIDINSWDLDSIRIEITKHGWGRTERKANQVLDNIYIDIQDNEHRLIVRERYTGKDDFNVLDLLEPKNWQGISGGHKRVDYKIIMPCKMNYKLKHDEGDVSIENLKGSFSISMNEGRCQLKNISYNDCRIEIDEGEIVLNRLIGENNSELHLYCDEGWIQGDSLTGDQAIFEVDDGHVRLEDIKYNILDCLVDEGNILAALHLVPQGRYDLSSSEGDIKIQLLNDVPIRVMLYSEGGRIDTNLDLKIRRSNESEKVRDILGKSAETFLKVLAEEGDIQLYQNLKN
ncbi:DUF4097 family beta strand repeat-containing protein [bacterium]